MLKTRKLSCFHPFESKTRQNTVINTVFLNKRCRNSRKNVKECCSYLTTLVSGSPIIQDGKLVGAVTHVMLADPTEGYGVFILLASFAVFTAALRALLRKRSARGAIFARSLVSPAYRLASLDCWKYVRRGTLDRMVAKLQARGVGNTPYEDKIW